MKGITDFLNGTVILIPAIFSSLISKNNFSNSLLSNFFFSYVAFILLFLIQKLCNFGENECSIGFPITKYFFIYDYLNIL